MGLFKLRMTVAGVAALMLGIGVITLVPVQRAEHDTLADQRERERELQEAVRMASVLSSRVLELQRGLRVSAEQPVNDTAGHATEDATLKAVAQALRRAASSLTDGAQPITPTTTLAPSPLVQPGAVLPPCHTPAPYPMAAACTGYTAQGSHDALSRRQLCFSCEHWLE